jgi:predicted nuclease with TOPRIM domain
MNEQIVPENRHNEREFELLAERAAELEEENQRLEEALRRNSRVFDELLITGDAGMALAGPDRRIVRVIRGVTGIDPQALVGRRIDELAVPEDRRLIVDAFQQLIERRRRKVRLFVRVRNSEGDVGLYRATLTDMLENPDIQGIVCNYSRYPFPEMG